MSVVPDSIVISLPEEWQEIPLEASAYRRFMAEQTEILKGARVLKRADIRQFELLSSVVYQLVQRERVLLASIYLGVEQDEDDGSARVVMAGLIASIMSRDALGTDVPMTAGIVVRALSGEGPAEEGSVRFVAVEPPAISDLGGVEAAKLIRLMSVEIGSGEMFRQLTQSYFVPVADGNAVIVLQFSTINIEYSRQFSDLFEAIAGTLRILYPDEPTFLDQNDDVLNEPSEVAGGSAT